MSFTFTPFFFPGFGGSVPGTTGQPVHPTTAAGVGPVHPTTYNALAAMGHPTTYNALAAMGHPTTYNALAAMGHPTTYNALAAAGHPTTYNAMAAMGPTTVNALAATTHTVWATYQAAGQYPAPYPAQYPAPYPAQYPIPVMPPGVPGAPYGGQYPADPGNAGLVSGAQNAALAADANLRADASPTTINAQLLLVNVKAGGEPDKPFLVYGPVVPGPQVPVTANQYVVIQAHPTTIIHPTTYAAATVHPTTIIENIAVWPAPPAPPVPTTIATPVVANVDQLSAPTTVIAPLNQVVLFSEKTQSNGTIEGVVTPTTVVAPAWLMGTNAQPTTVQFYQAVNLGQGAASYAGPAAPPQGDDEAKV